ncbi:hypothetical protein ACPOL_1052 [Acidisarcina polymorpha]|uniref:Uncharacterized protein n=1 Tax=Acidisarcina polymorpha TaxID=2211140 RepID=A0A2Z5FU85_9BACT|nr:hypothetical protein ACPOL_1052 [Acidisarcina polymorpha]
MMPDHCDIASNLLDAPAPERPIGMQRRPVPFPAIAEDGTAWSAKGSSC